MEISGNTTKEQLDEWVWNHPVIAYMIMMGIADGLGMPVGKVNNNNLKGFDHQASFPQNTTLDIGAQVVGIDMRRVTDRQ